MPPHFSHDIAWVIQGCILILHMISVAMTIFMNQLAVAETHNHVRFMMQSGVLSFWRRPENFALHLIHHILNVTYTLDINLHVVVHPEVSEQLQPSPPPIPIHPCPIPCPSPSHHEGSGHMPDTIIPLGVSFKLPCSICQRFLEQGQICCHLDPHTTVIRWDQTKPLWVHQESSFIFCRHLPNLDDPMCTILLWCPINLVFHNNSDGENIPPPLLPRTDSPDAYHSAFSTREPSSTRERSISPSRNLQWDKFRAREVRRHQSISSEDTAGLPSDVCNILRETMPHPSFTPQYVRNTHSSARRSLPSRRSTKTVDRWD